MKKLYGIFVAAALLLALSACGGGEPPTTTVAPTTTRAQAAGTFEKVRHAEITIKGYGTIKLELDEGTAPISVANFIKLAQAGFYDGLTFHRIMDGFMIQGGAPNASSTIQPETIKGEFSSNGVNNPIKHVTGVLSMARAKDPNSGSSQFFIMVADAPHLDGNYAAFGRVTEGLEIALQIAKDAKPTDNNGTIPAAQQPVIEKVVITD